MQLNTARVLLTGASGGLGQALARQLVQQGAQVLLAGRDAAKLQALQTQLGDADSVCVADLTQAQGVAALTQAAQAFKVNVLINNAGVSAFGLLHQQTWPTVEDVLQTNLLAPMRLTQALLPYLKALPHAAVVNIGSAFGSLPFAGFVAYSSAKAGLRGFSQSLRRELAHSQIHVLHVAPRAIDTKLNSPSVNALNRALGNASDSPETVANAIVAALQDKHSELHLGLPERLFAWLNGVAPGLIDRGLAGKLATIQHHAQDQAQAQNIQP
ncbi:MAG: SDR family oxidoreductase [Rhodoferax sp.]|nr:SDR family oxidoreductase [Betaproteobacteria bacterium]NCN96819.1 SDR family oxidoreductase [Rhodoferax sp.]PIZ21587.1 MAG: short chain dehydrogenase [Comamonadaceae bacterium CG_4_10_14_0_8_um_filter_57_29]PJC19481.1 MAG: short chain dehydrogenase [Comamonadaceae bacterium CG_4_9_14_0_8_um_filter_57_21]NCP82508.1 SDR family oxidoreductase [Rhodoferax sp.]